METQNSPCYSSTQSLHDSVSDIDNESQRAYSIAHSFVTIETSKSRRTKLKIALAHQVDTMNNSLLSSGNNSQCPPFNQHLNPSIICKV
jgi:hypothetical protein